MFLLNSLMVLALPLFPPSSFTVTFAAGPSSATEATPGDGAGGAAPELDEDEEEPAAPLQFSVSPNNAFL